MFTFSLSSLEMGRYIFLLWSILLVDKHSLFVFGEVITVTPGQNVSLPCTHNHMNDGTVVRWVVHSDYISTEKMIDESQLGLQSSYYSIPGEGADYSLLVKIPDDINIWKHLNSTYECRLIFFSINSIINTVTLNIYKSLPKCTSLHINDTSSIASCSYNMPPDDIETLMLRSNGNTLTTINCLKSNVCTLNYIYNPADIAPYGLTCDVSLSGMISISKSCSIIEMHSTTSPEATTTGATEISSIRNTPPTTMFQSTPIKTPDTSSQGSTTTTDTTDTPSTVISDTSITTKEARSTVEYDIESDSNIYWIREEHFIVAIACIFSAFLILFLIELYRCIRRRSPLTTSEQIQSQSTQNINQEESTVGQQTEHNNTLYGMSNQAYDEFELDEDGYLQVTD